MGKKYYLLNVRGNCGYSFVVPCDASDEYEAIDMALEQGLFDNPKDADNCYAEEADEDTVISFIACGAVRGR